MNLYKGNLRQIQKFIIVALVMAALLGSLLPMGTTYALEPEEAAWVEEARAALREIASEREITAVVYLSAAYPLRTEPSYESTTVFEIPCGQTVEIQDAFLDDSYTAWEYVSFFNGEQEYQGYIPRGYLACSDERFLQWEMEYGMNPGQISMFAAEGAQASYADIEQFPASYQTALKALKDKHPNWIFVPMNTGLDWNTVIANELLGGKSLVYKSFAACTKEGAYDDGNWFYASEDVLKRYMDPRNSLTEETIFQFEQLTYNASYHTQEALELFLNNTFMKCDKNAPGTAMTYGKIIWNIGREEQISPFHMAARIYQEQGAGTSALISGTYPGYEKLYNYFNVGATGKTAQEVIVNGLTYAKNAKPQWDSAYYSIQGGARVISSNYIKKGQGTLYLQKYNVNPLASNPVYTHQYMQNISAPTTEAKKIMESYKGANSLENPFVFTIPVFNNMPETPCPMPTASTNVVLQVPAGYNTTVWIDGAAYSPASRNGRQIVKTPGTGAKSAVVYQYNTAGVPVGMYVWTLDYLDNAYTATPQPELANLLSYHGFSIRVTGKSGIRFKTGVAADLRTKLTTTGVGGYTLKEYGTLIMNNANLNTYPMIKGGEKVLSGMSYGTNASGGLDDKIYESVDGRYRFTSVLVGLPVDQYKTEYAFRGYLVLEKNGQQTTIYGPTVARSIYSLAQQVVNAGTYAQGSDADTFLRKLIADADALGQ